MVRLLDNSPIGHQRPAKQNQSSPALVSVHFVFGDLAPLTLKVAIFIRQTLFSRWASATYTEQIERR